MEAINIAKGTVISFLEDDDLFFENKLEIVYKEFKKDNDVVYYHNLWMPINKNGETININYINTFPDVNMSSISIKKSIVKIDEENKINISTEQDTLMYLYALESNKKIIKGKERLTYYMLHNSTSNIVSNKFEEYRKFVITNSDLSINNYIFFKNIFHSRKAINYLDSRITGLEIKRYIFGSNEFPSKYINYMINSFDGLKYKVESFLACILIEIYPKSRGYISNKIWNIHSNRSNEMI